MLNQFWLNVTVQPKQHMTDYIFCFRDNCGKSCSLFNFNSSCNFSTTMVQMTQTLSDQFFFFSLLSALSILYICFNLSLFILHLSVKMSLVFFFLKSSFIKISAFFKSLTFTDNEIIMYIHAYIFFDEKFKGSAYFSALDIEFE